MRSKTLHLIAGLLLITGAACAPSLYVPGPDTVKNPSVKMEDLAAGRAIYIEKCGSCHRLQQPKKFNADAWTKIMDVMAPKAKLTAAQKDLVYQFVINQK